MKELTFEDTIYFTQKRDVELERLNRRIREHASDNSVNEAMISVLRLNKQLKLVEDALVIQRIIDDQKT